MFVPVSAAQSEYGCHDANKKEGLVMPKESEISFSRLIRIDTIEA